jgi:peptidyl-prolyl cis-trans isomerase B (cyclophilin B)
MVADAPYLDGQYAAFGCLTEGLDVARKIVSVPRNRQDRPVEDQRMKTVTIDEIS